MTGGRRLPILPDCNRSAVSCSPLEGDCRPPRRRTANRTRKGPVFFLRCAPETFMLLACLRRCLRGGRSRTTLFPPGNARGRQMAWTTPTLVEICIRLQINGYLPAEFVSRPVCVGPEWGDSPPSCSARRREEAFLNGIVAVRHAVWHGRATHACGRAPRRVLPSPPTVKTGS